ncbi:hypothetical protein [Pelagibacterium sediminicola]|nr:hypothetical protein [Pelagibacterium sediminicola]
MEKRDRFIAAIRKEAKSLGLYFSVHKGRGKGGHAMIHVGGRFTTLP